MIWMLPRLVSGRDRSNLINSCAGWRMGGGGDKRQGGRRSESSDRCAKELCEKQFHFSIIDVKAILKVWSQFLGSAGK